MTILGTFGLNEFNVEFAQARAIEEDEAIMGPGASVKSRFRELREAMQTLDDEGGFLVPPESVVDLAVHLGMLRLPDRTKWDDLVHVKIGHKPRWWQWLFHNYSTDKIASFLIWRWPKFPDIVNINDECCIAHREETECRVQKAYEFLQKWLKGRESNDDR